MTPAEVCDFLKVAPSTLRDWQNSGRIPFVRLPNGRPRFDPDVIERWTAEQCPPVLIVRPSRRR